MNTAAASAYTPLECLLLFQSLVVYGTQDDVFTQISELLNTTPLVKEGPTYDAQRLSAGSLQAQYLQLLHDELKAEEQEGQDDGTELGSKKRKLQSPPLPNLRDAQQYQDKLPLLVDRLYARYRDYMTRAIREDERKYAAVQREIDEIERGEWDERILKEQEELKNGDNAVSAEQSQPVIAGKTNGTNPIATPLLEPKSAEIQTPQAIQEAPIPRKVSPLPRKVSPLPASSPRPDLRPGSLPPSDSSKSQSQTPAPSSPRVDLRPQNGAKNIQPAIVTPRQESNGSQGQHFHPLQPQPQPQPQGGNNFTWETPYTMGPQGPQVAQYQPGNYPQQFNSHHPQSPHSGFAIPSRVPFPPQGLQYPHPHIPSSPSPLNPQQALPPHPQGRSPSGMDALAHHAGQQQRAGPPSPIMYQGHLPAAGYPPQHHPQQMQTPLNAPSQFQHHPPQNSGYPSQFQPYHPSPAQVPFQAPLAPENKGYSSPYVENQAAIQAAIQAPKGKRISSIAASQPQPNTPASRGVHKIITGTGTRWTPNATPTTPRPNVDVQPPQMEPLSPVLTHSKPPSNVKKSAPKKASKNEARKAESRKIAVPPESPKTGKPTRRNAQRTRAGSTASSVIAGSHRSQSVMSHADEMSVDNDSHRHVKQEVATPVGVEDAGDTTADESTAALPRHGSRADPSPRQTSKRKRDTESTGTPKSRPPPTPPNHVLWTRGFQKISSSALETISGHKSASIFGAPIKERDAPGYKHLILRPQDLKSIRSAIASGHRAASAAAPDDLPASQSNVWLPISEDLVPPKGIINNAQLEKELMRMFANAIMFNPDPKRGFGGRWRDMAKGRGEGVGFEIDEDGIVRDSKVMYADVEKVVQSLRSAEMRSEEMREASLAVAEEDGDEEVEREREREESGGNGNLGSVAKRRRKV